MQRAVLAHFLRAARTRLTPRDAGLAGGPHRRVPGLRREEVARLAAISVDTYTRLEQARGATPSAPVVEALARALRLSGDERAHLFQLTGQPLPDVGAMSQAIAPTVLRLLERMDDTAAFVLDAAGYVLAWNPLAAALIADFSCWPPEQRNLIWQVFCGTTGAAADYSPADWEAFARDCVADLRAAAARYPHDPRITELVARLQTDSEQFTTWWDEHRVATRSSGSKRLLHPVVGEIDIDITVLVVPDHDQRVIIYSAQPGTPSAQALRLLAVIGTQTLA
ncbi:MAG: transcriptional regulator [Pseudonocardiales bacterium]|nr:MAG: transcriptional regulator [Pseudonocardiales bacterium]